MEPPKKKLNQNKSRFIVYSESEIAGKHDAARNINTSRSEGRANSAFQKFLTQIGKDDVRYWLYEEDELDLLLGKFWFGARKDPDKDYESDPEDNQKEKLMYSANTMRNFQYALNRILKSKGHNYDIISPSSLSFKRSQKAFTASQKELKKLGKAAIKSTQEISEDGKHAFNWSCNCDQSLFVFTTKTKTRFMFYQISRLVDKSFKKERWHIKVHVIV